MKRDAYIKAALAIASALHPSIGGARAVSPLTVRLSDGSMVEWTRAAIVDVVTRILERIR